MDSAAPFTIHESPHCKNFYVLTSFVQAFLSDTYTRVFEQKLKAGLGEQALLILDLEWLMFWNRTKTGKSYLIYAEVIEEEDKQDDMEIGIAQKVTKVGDKINKKTESSIKSAEERIMKSMQTTKEENKDLIKVVSTAAKNEMAT